MIDKAHVFDTVGMKASGHTIKRLYCSDIHLDSTECERSMFKDHLKESDEVYIFGDLFDVMQSHWDKRKTNGATKNLNPDKMYIDSVIDDAVSFLEPFKNKIKFISDGNHETKISQMAGIDILMYLIHKLGVDIKKGDYQGFLVHRALKLEKVGFNNPIITYYHHGSGGNSKRSKGILDNQINGFLAPDADIIVSGHNHWKWFDPSNTRLRLNGSYNIIESDQYVLRLGSYKKAKRHGWGTEKGFLPSRRGGWFVEMQVRNHVYMVKRIYEAN